MLAGLIRKKREFRLVSQSEWTAIWEVVHHTAFADPAIACFLSKEIGAQAIWLKLDADYNIWAYQIFERGTCVAETYLPESYFQGGVESSSPSDHGACLQLAEAVGALKNLPAFLASLRDLERQADNFPSIVTLKCKLPIESV